jgi:hypothetical protein
LTGDGPLFQFRTVHRNWKTTALAAAIIAGAGPALGAQIPATRDTTHRSSKHLFTLDDAALGAAFAGLTIAMFPTDEEAAEHLPQSSAPHGRFDSGVATGIELLADPGSLIIGSSMYAIGRLTHHRELADVGLHGTESIVVGSGITALLKGLAGRSRPYASHGIDPRDWKFGGGFGNADRTSFPSGHTTTAFAAASALTSEVSRLYPREAWIAGPILYSGATAVGISRMYHNKHWASDVALGAAIGTFSGIKIVRYSHSHPGNPVDRKLLDVIVAPNGMGGGIAGISIPLR